jgi:serine/threonine protein kinase
MITFVCAKKCLCRAGAVICESKGRGGEILRGCDTISHVVVVVLQAVHTIHEARIVHSDLKPANFLMVEGTLKLIDFGIAKAIQSDTTSIARESQVGTLNYMSPEAILGGANNIRGGPPMKVPSLPLLPQPMPHNI